MAKYDDDHDYVIHVALDNLVIIDAISECTVYCIHILHTVYTFIIRVYPYARSLTWYLFMFCFSVCTLIAFAITQSIARMSVFCFIQTSRSSSTSNTKQGAVNSPLLLSRRTRTLLLQPPPPPPTMQPQPPVRTEAAVAPASNCPGDLCSSSCRFVSASAR